MRMTLNKKSIAACIMVGAIAVAGSCSALAANVNTPAKETKAHCSQQVNVKSTLETALKTLVSKGTLTQDQANKILNSCTNMQGHERGVAPEKMSTQKGGGFANQLVKDGTLTQAQATAIETAMKAARESKKSLTDVMTELVSSAVITQAQADTLAAKMPAKEQAKGGGFENQLVKDGTITQAQATTIESAIKAARESKKPLTNVMSELVSSAVITQAQADTLTAKMPGKEQAKGGGFLAQLVKNGTITQEQETAIKTELNQK